MYKSCDTPFISSSVSETQFFWIEFIRFLQVTPDRLMIIRSLKSHWIVTINAKMHVWKCKHTTAEDRSNPFLVGTCGLRLLHSTVYIFNTALNKLFTTVMYIRPYHHTVITSVCATFSPTQSSFRRRVV